MTTFADGENGLSVRTKINDVLQHMDGTAGTLVVNEAGADVDFRVESDTEINALFVDGATGFVGLGTGTPQHSLLVTASSAFTAILKISDRATQSSGALVFGDNGSSNASVGLWRGAANSFTTAGNTLNIQGESIQLMGAGLFGAGPERMRIDSVGNVGIGAGAITAIFGKTLQVGDGSGNSSISLLGTGAGSLGDVYLASFSNVASLVARASTPLVFGSNDTERMRITEAGNVGIGTSTAGARLTVNSGAATTIAQFTSTGTSAFLGLTNSGASAFIGADVTGAFVVQTPGSGYSTKLIIDSAGNAGLGVTPSAWVNHKALEINGGAISGYSFNNPYTLDLSLASYATALNTWLYRFTGQTASRYQQSAGEHRFLSAPAGTAGNTITFTQAMTLDASGNLGIGTTVPLAKLDVFNGNINLRATNYTTTSRIGFGNPARNDDAAFIQYVGNGNFTGYIAFGTNAVTASAAATEKMRIAPGGELLIGTTTGPAAVLLQVASDALVNGLTVGKGLGSIVSNTAVGVNALVTNTTGSGNTANGLGALQLNTTGASNSSLGYAALNINTSGGNNTAIGFNTMSANTTGVQNTVLGHGAGSALTTGNNNTIIGSIAGTAGLANTVIIAAGTTERLRIDANGNMGLGVTPSAWAGAVPRAIQTTGNFGITTTATMYLISNGYYDGSSWRYLATGGASYYRQNGGENAWFNAASGTAENPITFTQAMTLDTSGNLGIGTTTPGAKLDVSAGNVFISQDYTIDWKAGAVTRASVRGTSADALTFSTRRGGTITEAMRIDTSGNVGIGTATPNAAAILDVQSTTKGVRFPNMTTTEKNAIANVAGNVIFDTTLGKLCVNTGSGWQTITSA